jgi:hypothetical protein
MARKAIRNETKLLDGGLDAGQGLGGYDFGAIENIRDSSN